MTAKRDRPLTDKESAPQAKLSRGELEIMSLLWQHGAITLAEARELFGRPIGYTTVQTRLNRLVDKRLARRGRTRPARYEAVITPEQVSAGHLHDLVERVTGGRVVPLVAHLVGQGDLTAEEILELKELISQAELRLAKPKGKKP